ncbi:leucine-rich repeat-containing protein 74A-like isoform X3 [Photinus pyralis]|uniref:leucine-rich repeat-containing protein 74A-like isoform X3 n=1 Tax=Photinus pyralis TaxID=7054 RepID=UPI0012672FD6|nr:leucine-rich repeat-containing protein 74A-like isoform X3 [Photinus pyralis]
MNDDDEDSIFDLYQLNELRAKNTDSFRCLAQIVVSHSSIFRHPLYPFPPLEDPGLDEAVSHREKSMSDDGVGAQYYLNMCQSLKIVPLKRVSNSLITTVLNLKYFGLKDKQIKAITETLMRNRFVQHLILEDNWLSTTSMEYISQMLANNSTVYYLNLRECRIGPEGAAALSMGISSSISLIELDLSFNDLGDDGVEHLEDSLEDTRCLQTLNLSHNNLGERAANTLSFILTFNSSLAELDLSWNNFNTPKGNKLLFTALGGNESIRKLSIAWNGISSNEATRPMMNYLSASTSLVEFDISSNRLTDASFRNVRNGLGKCKKLKTLKIGNNLLTSEEAMELIKLLATSPKLLEVNMENTFIKPDCLPDLRRSATK